MKELIRGIRENNQSNEWWKEKLDFIADRIVAPLVALGMDEEDLKQDIFLILYEKINDLGSEGRIVNIGQLRQFIQRKLISTIAPTVDIKIHKLLSKLQKNEFGNESEKLLTRHTVVPINSLTTLSYEQKFDLHQVSLEKQMDNVLDSITSRQEKVLRMRFGLNNEFDHDLTLEEVGRQFKVIRNRIRQIEAMALRRLRRRDELIEYLDRY